MATGRRATSSGLLRGNGVLPVVAGLASALALSGAAVYTVESVPCDDGGQYVRHAHSTELIGGCVDGNQLPNAPGEDHGTPGEQNTASHHDNYRR